MTRYFSLRGIFSASPFYFLAAVLITAASAQGQDSQAPRRQMENRFLFVVENSSAMKARAAGVNEAVLGLLLSDMNGELRNGDTIGLWNYSDGLDTGFPMQRWGEGKKDGIIRNLREHLEKMPYQKRGHLEKVLPEIGNVLAHSERLTVILVFDGSDPLRGTPFDKDINALHKEYAREFKESHAPFVTVLAARQGRIFDYTINYPGSVVIPHTADPLPPPAPVSAVTPPPQPAPVVAIQPEAPKPPPHRIEIVLSGSNFHHNATAPAPELVQAAPVITPPPAPLVSEPVPAPPSQTIVQTAIQPAPVAVIPTPAAAAVQIPTATPIPAPPAPIPAAAQVAAPVIPAVVATSTGEQLALFVIAISLLTIAVVLVIFLIRRSKAAAAPSLITQSIDRSR